MKYWVLVAVLGLVGRVWAVDWRGKVGIGGFAEVKKVPVIDETLWMLSKLGLTTIDGGISISYGATERFRIGIDFLVGSAQTTFEEKGEEKVVEEEKMLIDKTIAFGRSEFLVGAHGLFDIVSRERGSLYGILRIGYARTSLEYDYRYKEEDKEEDRIKESLNLNQFITNLGFGFETLTAGNTGVALEGDLFSLRLGSGRGGGEEKWGEREEKGKIDRTFISYDAFFIVQDICKDLLLNLSFVKS